MAFIKLVVADKNIIISSLHKKTDSNHASLLKSLEEFQHDVNATMSKLINDHGDSGQILSENSEDEYDDEEESTHTSAKKKKIYI